MVKSNSNPRRQDTSLKTKTTPASKKAARRRSSGTGEKAGKENRGSTPAAAPLKICAVWGCTCVADEPRGKLCPAHHNQFRAKTGHNLCLMRVAHGHMPFHGISARLLDESSRNLECVAAMPCYQCRSIKPASELRLARVVHGSRAQDATGRFLFHHSCRLCIKDSLTKVTPEEEALIVLEAQRTAHCQQPPPAQANQPFAPAPLAPASPYWQQQPYASYSGGFFPPALGSQQQQQLFGQPSGYLPPPTSPYPLGFQHQQHQYPPSSPAGPPQYQQQPSQHRPSLSMEEMLSLLELQSKNIIEHHKRTMRSNIEQLVTLQHAHQPFHQATAAPSPALPSRPSDAPDIQPVAPMSDSAATGCNPTPQQAIICEGSPAEITFRPAAVIAAPQQQQQQQTPLLPNSPPSPPASAPPLRPPAGESGAASESRIPGMEFYDDDEEDNCKDRATGQLAV